MISTLAHYVDAALDRVTDSYVDMRDAIRPVPRVTIVDDPQRGWCLPDGRPILPASLPIGANITLFIRPDDVLVIPLVLPIGAKPYIAGVIASQIDRISPWTAEQAVFGSTVTHETATEVHVRIAIASRSAIAHRISTLGISAARALSFRVQTQVHGKGGEIELGYDVNTKPSARAERRIIAACVFGAIAVAFCAELAAYIIGGNIANRDDIVRSQMATLRETIAGVQLGSDVKADPLARMVQAKLRDVPRAELIDELARVTPDQTYLTALEIDPEKIHIEGNSTAVNDLPKALGDTPLFGDVMFSAPMAKRRDGEGETFQIDIAIHPLQGPQP